MSVYVTSLSLSPIGKAYVWECQLEMRHKLIYSTYHDNQEQEHTTLASHLNINKITAIPKQACMRVVILLSYITYKNYSSTICHNKI